MDSEKQHLIETYLEPLAWYHLRSLFYQLILVWVFFIVNVLFPVGTSPVEDSEDSEDSLRLSELCQEMDNASRAEREARRAARKKLFIACAVSLVFMTGKVIGGYAAHSLAIMTDAAHLLTDFGSIVISIFSLLISSRPQTETMTFGWHRAEILGMFVSVVSVWAVTAVLVFSATQRILDGGYDIDSQLMLITSGCAVGANIFMVLILHQSGASHSHGTPAGQPQEDKRPHRCDHSSASVRAAFVHVLGDLLQSVGVLLAATIIHFWPEYKVADPICTFLFSVLVIGTTLPVTKDVFRVLMEGAPGGISSSSVKELLLSVRGVLSVSRLNMWSLNMNHYLLSAHVLTDEDADSQLILRKATKLLRSKLGFSSVTIQVERCRISASP
ncbi:zinc transporter 2-like [Kryptolebias marmoratus]|uniref:Probable proton-coupled zinc antiporter SLC30A3 n=1 Tax=Kryptolebias marmoratus TaxID=37003 RepID=A0A3Q3AYI4_KRYMA|nr:zinc transporter 2-like [Kryptolebias marmoratus]